MCCSQTFTCCIRIRSCICRIRSRNCTRSYRLTRRRRCALLPGQRSWQQVTGCTGYWRRIRPYIPASINCSCGSRSRWQLLHWPCSHRQYSHNKPQFHNHLYFHNRYRRQHMPHPRSQLSRHNSHHFHYNHHIHYNSYFIFSFQLGCTLLYGHVRNV